MCGVLESLYAISLFFYFLALCIISAQVLTVFEKLRKATTSFVSSVCPAVSMNKLAPTGGIFTTFRI